MNFFTLKKTTWVAIALFLALGVMAKDKTPKSKTKSEPLDSALMEAMLIQHAVDSIEHSFTYKHGTIELPGGIGKVVVPTGFKYLDPKQSEHVLVDLWGNPKGNSNTLGLIFPEDKGVLADSSFVFNIEYDAIGYVKDDDAEDINYAELLGEIQKDAAADNVERKKGGYETISVVGWAATPYYDSKRKVLHWAKEIKFENQEVNTLNYNVRVLGRKGVLILNAIASMPQLPAVQKNIDKVLNMVQFNDGYKYENFDSNVDEVAAWTIGGLVAGKVLAKVGFFAVILKFWKIIILAVGGFFAAIWKRIRRKKDEEDTTTPVTTPTVIKPETQVTEAVVVYETPSHTDDTTNPNNPGA